MKGEPKHKWSKRAKIQGIICVVSILITVMLWQLPVETVFAEGEGDMPEFLATLHHVGIYNITFQLKDAEIEFEINNETYKVKVDSAIVTITKVVHHPIWHPSEESIEPVPPAPVITEITIYIDIQGATVDIPQVKLTLNKLLLEMKFMIQGNKSIFKVTGTTYVPVYRLIQSAMP